MPIVSTHPPVESPDLPDGVAVQPRRFEFDDLDAIPRHWYLDNPVLTQFENAFSLVIPPGERFFVRSVNHYLDRLPDQEARALVDAFAEQEALHSAAHEEFNASTARFGVDVEREVRYAEDVFERLSRILPAWAQLGVTAFSEHLTAVGAYGFIADPELRDWMDPQIYAMWRWHAAEELEHKAVAFDLFERYGGGYGRRVASAGLTVAYMAVPLARIVNRLMRQDRRPTSEERRQARRVQGQMMRRQARMIARYFRPGFHPWTQDDSPHLREWYAEAEAAPKVNVLEPQPG